MALIDTSGLNTLIGSTVPSFIQLDMTNYTVNGGYAGTLRVLGFGSPQNANQNLKELAASLADRLEIDSDAYESGYNVGIQDLGFGGLDTHPWMDELREALDLLEPDSIGERLAGGERNATPVGVEIPTIDPLVLDLDLLSDLDLDDFTPDPVFELEDFVTPIIPDLNLVIPDPEILPLPDPDLIPDPPPPSGFGEPENPNEPFVKPPLKPGPGDPEINLINGYVEVAEHGGDTIELVGDLVSYFDPALDRRNKKAMGGFIAAAVRSSNTRELYILNSSVPGQGPVVFSNNLKQKAYFTTPPMPRGKYHMLIGYGNGASGHLNYALVLNCINVMKPMRNDYTKAISQNIPIFMKAPYRNDQWSAKEYEEGDYSNNSAIIMAMSEVMNRLLYADYTILTEPTQKGHRVINVESTKGWPMSGTVWIGQKYYNYIKKRESAILLEEDMDLVYPAFTRITQKDTSAKIHNYYQRTNAGLYKPRFTISDSEWESAFNRVYQGVHTNEPVLFNYFRDLFKSVELKCNVNINTAGRMTFGYSRTFESMTEFNITHVQKPVIIRNKLYWIKNFSKNDRTVELDLIGSGYWNGWYDYDHKTGTYTPPTEALADEEVIILPWFWRQDDNGKFILEIEGSTLNSLDNFIDVNFIDFDIFFTSQLDGEDEGTDLNLSRLLASGVLGKIVRSFKTNDQNVIFGTNFNREDSTNGVVIQPSTEY